MTGTLDLCSHRLDAWITSFATKRLAEMRKASPTGVLFGGYGWVMNLKPAAAQTTVARAARRTRPGLSIRQQSRLHPHAFADAGRHRRDLAQRPSGPCRQSDSRTICWPSICRRSVCGWRRGCSTACDRGNRSARCSVTASSADCRKPGKPQFISSFRELAPLVARKLETSSQPDQPVEAIAANNVVDGLAAAAPLAAAQDLCASQPPHGTASTMSFCLAHKQAAAGRSGQREITAFEAELRPWTIRSMPSAMR